MSFKPLFEIAGLNYEDPVLGLFYTLFETCIEVSLKGSGIIMDPYLFSFFESLDFAASCAERLHE